MRRDYRLGKEIRMAGSGTDELLHLVVEALGIANIEMSSYRGRPHGSSGRCLHSLAPPARNRHVNSRKLP